jgi:outer membrane protein OmpA-like peptidoglycan-associated protein
MRRLVLWTLPSLWIAAGCAHPPRPAAMAEADTVRKAPAAATAAALAPEAFAHAEKTRREAEDAYQSGDLSGAQILGERAVAAYQHALVLARIASATETANRARAAIRAAEQSFAETDGEQKRVAAQADDLEVRIKVIKDAVPVGPAGPADAAREQARLGSARSLALDAKLLCAAAKMVGSDTPILAKAQSSLEDLTKRLGEKSRAPIEAAMRARAECLSALTAARRVASTTSSTGRSDQLLSEVSAMGGLFPVRDDRGVVVTLRELFAANQLTHEARERLTSLGRVAQAHDDFPVQVVVHSSKASATTEGDEDRRRGEAVAQSLVDAGAKKDRVSVEAAGTAHPVLEPARDPKRNERIEIIFVDPGG